MNIKMADNSTECQLYPGEYDKCLILKYLKLASSSISIIAALIALMVIVYFRLFKDFTQRMVINLCVASLLLAVSFMVTQFEEEITTVCIIQGAAILFSLWACLLWVMCILANIYTRVIFRYEWKQKEVLASSLCWVLSAIFAGMPFIGKDVYAPTEVWCWIRNDTGWRFGIWYIWHILSVHVFIFAMIHIIWVLHKQKGQLSAQDASQLDALKEDIKTLRRYPIVYTLFSIIAIACRIENIFHGSSFVMLILFELTGPLLGSAVAFVFVIDRTTLRLFNRKEIRKAYQKWTNKGTPVQVYSAPEQPCSINSGLKEGENRQVSGVICEHREI